MSPLVIGILGLIAFLILMFLGVPIPFSMLIAGAVGIAIVKNPAVAASTVVNQMVNMFSSYNMTVSPMFGLMGFLACYTGLGKSLFEAINAFLGHHRGGLAMATECACAGFGAICGSVPATISTFSAIAYPEMRARNYNPSLAGSSIAAGATLAVLIPPSSNFIIYGAATDTSIGRLFVAGIIPGLMLLVLFILAIAWTGWRHPDWSPTGKKYTAKERWVAVREGGIIEIIIVFLISMGGMMAGMFTPTEAGAVGAVGMFLVTLITKKVNVKKFFEAIMAGARLAAMVFLLLACANIFGALFTMSGIPHAIGSFVESLAVPKFVIMLVIILIYFILGMFTDLLSMILVTMPIFFPIVCDFLGYDPIWFGVVTTLLIAIGGITPPVGSGVFLLMGSISDPEATVGKVFRGVWPFVVATLVCTLILIVFPDLATILPTLVYG